MKTDWKNEHASCRVVQNPELPPEMERVREVVRVHTDEDHRRQGYGTELMQAVCDEADVLGIVLMLQPLPFGHTVPKGAGAKDERAVAAIRAEKLIAWYSRFGFMKTQNNPVLMARAPSFRAKLTGVVSAVDGLTRG